MPFIDFVFDGHVMSSFKGTAFSVNSRVVKNNTKQRLWYPFFLLLSDSASGSQKHLGCLVLFLSLNVLFLVLIILTLFDIYACAR